MDVIGHQTIREYAHMGRLQSFPNQPEVQLPVGCRKEDLLAIGPALRHIVRYAGRDDTSISWHIRFVRKIDFSLIGTFRAVTVEATDSTATKRSPPANATAPKADSKFLFQRVGEDR